MNYTESIQPTIPTASTSLDAVQELSVLKSHRDQEKLVDVAKKFEGMLIHEMFKQVKESLETMKDTGDDEESSETCDEQYQSLYWSQMADAVSEQGGLGLWKSIYQQIQHQADSVGNGGALLSEKL